MSYPLFEGTLFALGRVKGFRVLLRVSAFWGLWLGASDKDLMAASDLKPEPLLEGVMAQNPTFQLLGLL